MRIDARVEPGLYSLDDARAIPDLIAQGQRDARHNLCRVADRFLRDFEYLRFQAVHALEQSCVSAA